MAKDTLEKAAGAGPSITIAGKKYGLRPFKVGEYVKLRSYIRGERISDFRANAEGMDQQERMEILIRLSSETISQYELMQEAMTPDGMLFLLSLLLQETDPTMTHEKLLTLLDDQTFADLEAISQGLNVEEGQPVNPPIAPSD